MENYQIDNLDRGILEALMANARTAYAELAKQFGVSPGTIHVRVEKMKQAGIITGAIGTALSIFILVVLIGEFATGYYSNWWDFTDSI